MRLSYYTLLSLEPTNPKIFNILLIAKKKSKIGKYLIFLQNLKILKKYLN